MNLKSPKRDGVPAQKNSRRLFWWPATLRGRVISCLSFLIGALLLVVAVFAASVWVENRFPSEDAERALLPRTQRVVTKPLVKVLSRQIEHTVRSHTEAAYMYTSLTLEEAMARFLDERVGLGERRMYSYRLARDGSAAAIAALLKVFHSAPPEHKAFMAQLIGSAGNPGAKDWLIPLLKDTDSRVVIGSVRGLSAIGNDDVTSGLGKILADSQRAQTIRVEAALGLGTIGTPVARDALVRTLEQTTSDELKRQVLDSLGRFEYPTVAATFTEFLSAPNTPGELRVAAAEALARSSEHAIPFLLELAQADADQNVRASAAWAISAHQDVKHIAPELTDLAERERAPDVRRRLYEALTSQTDIPAERLLSMVQAEKDIAARVAGFNAVASAAHQEAVSTVAGVFDKEIVPELQQIATSPNSLNIQMRAVFALRRAQTTSAQAALASIATTAHPQVAAAARNGLAAANRLTQK